MAADETTPLVANKPDQTKRSSWVSSIFSVEHRLLLTGFLITLSFSYTQVPLLYVFRRMSCDAYYDNHPPYTGDGDRCMVDGVAAGTAQQYSILGMTTTACGTLNLFVAGWMSKKVGPRTALLAQIYIPAIRVVAQILGLVAGKMTGMLIIQCTQLITILGGPVGYILLVNVIAGEIAEPERRTILFGKLQGILMLGQSIAFLSGGMIGDKLGLQAPFNLACVSFIFAGIFARLALPYIPPGAGSTKNSKKSGFLAPLKVLSPQRLRLNSGKIIKHYGVIFLCAGIFTGVLATDYAPLLIQMYASAAFNFDQAANGWLMSSFALMRSVFLVITFPRIISWGRKQVVKKLNARQAAISTDDIDSAESSDTEVASETSTLLPTEPVNFDAPTGGAQGAQEPIPVPKKDDSADGARFDLIFLRYSLVVDGLLTTLSAFATQPWHIYMAAILLPFGSGSAAAAKGVITKMCPESQRADALNVVTLVENTARLATQGLFGLVFAGFANIGKAYLTFFCNAAIAMVGMCILLFSHFPPEGTELVEEDEAEEESETTY